MIGIIYEGNVKSNLIIIAKEVSILGILFIGCGAIVLRYPLLNILLYRKMFQWIYYN